MSNQREPAQKGHRTIIIAAFAVLLVALIVCIVLLLSRPEEKQAQAPDTGVEESVLSRGFVEEGNAEEVMSEMADKVAEGMFKCRMTMDWTFEDGNSESRDAYVANAEDNLHTLYFDVYDRATDELLYSSPMLPVGTEIKGIKLEKELPAGEYDAVVMYTLVDEAYEEVSEVGFNITISIKH